ncbi:MAG: SLC13 family permease [Minwuia sp.]|nr:SLC13 family permease [Minwuia sp.]
MTLRPAQIIATAFFAAGAALLLLPVEGLSREAAMGGALALCAIGLWATNAIPEHLTALLFFLVAMITGVAAAPVVFSGFASAAFWLLFGGMIVGAAVRDTGLGARVAGALARRMGVSYLGVLAGIMCVALGLAFVMPSSVGRVVLLMPVALGLADVFGFEQGSKGRTGIAITAGLGAFLPGFGIMPANVPNLVMIGAADTLYGLKPVYGDYLLLHFPVLGLLKAITVVAVIRLLFPDRIRGDVNTDVSPGPLSVPERRLVVILAAALLLWATDFVHGVSPAWVALGAGIACMLPPFRLIDAAKLTDAVQFRPLLYIAGVLSLGAVVATTGIADHMASAFLNVADLAPGQDAWNFLAVTTASIGVSLLGTAPTVPAVLTPLAEQLSVAMGLPLATTLMMQVPAYSTVLFPFQGPPIVVAMQLGNVRMADGIRATLVVAIITILVLLPLDYLWWQVLGRFDG